MHKQDILNIMTSPGIIAIIRSDHQHGLVRAAHALYDAGITTVEISLTTPGTLDAIRLIREQLPDGCVIGVGTVVTPETVSESVAQGAQFAVSPVFSESVIEACTQAGIPIVCGAYTPTEAWHAFTGGADFIKIFPANQLGPDYIKALLAPMPQLPLVPTGGVTLQNCASYLRAGSVAVAIGTSVVNTQLIKDENWEGITHRAQEYVKAVKRAGS